MTTVNWSALLLPVLATLLVIAGSLGNPPQLPVTWFDFAHLDKVKHFGAYALLAVLWLRGLRQGVDYRRRPSPWAVVLALSALGAGLEFAQYAMHAGRLFEYGDMLANLCGAAAGAWAGQRLLMR